MVLLFETGPAGQNSIEKNKMEDTMMDKVLHMKEQGEVEG